MGPGGGEKKGEDWPENQSVTQTAVCNRQVERAGRRNGLHKGLLLQAHPKTRWLVGVKWIRTHADGPTC